MRSLRTAQGLACFLMAAAAFTVGGALFFEHGLSLVPCELCLKERIPYYVAIPLAAILIWSAGQTHRSWQRFSLVGFLVLACVFIGSALFGGYHAGVEWGLWKGPLECGGGSADASTVEGFLSRLQTVQVVRCDEAAWRFLTLSLAGWNALISAFLAGCSLFGGRLMRLRYSQLN